MIGKPALFCWWCFKEDGRRHEECLKIARKQWGKGSEYTIKFQGRQVGAIGIFSNFTVKVYAETPKDAILKVYETHEHLTEVIVNGRPYWPDGTERDA